MIPIQQEPDLLPRSLVRESGLTVAIMIAACVGAVLLLGGHRLFAMMKIETEPPPQLETQLFRYETESERAQIDAAERLKRYGWVDRTKGIVHIPMDVAIEIYLEKAKQMGGMQGGAR